MMINELIFFTTNSDKIKEAEYIFNPIGFQIVAQTFEFIELQSGSQGEVLLDKLAQVQHLDARPVLVDETGFYLKAYPNFPGVKNKFADQASGHSKILQLLSPDLSHQAYFYTVVGLYINGNISVFTGRCNGAVPDTPRGEMQSGLFFESIFIPNGASQTMAEMSREIRQRYSCRTAAFNKVVPYLLKF